MEPLDVSFNRIPASKRTDKIAHTLIGEMWDADGLWTVLIKPSKADRVLYAGSVLPAQTCSSVTAGFGTLSPFAALPRFRQVLEGLLPC